MTTTSNDVLLSPIRLNDLEALIENSVRRAVSAIETKNEEDTILSFEEGCNFLNLQPATVYGKTSRREIPFIKQGKHIRFSKADLTAWLKQFSKKPRLEAA